LRTPGYDASKIEPIKVVLYEGNTWSLGNRRLLSFKEAGAARITLRLESLEDPKIRKEFLNKHYPINDGTIVIIGPRRGRDEAERILRELGKIRERR
jgi:hypothetical protein